MDPIAIALLTILSALLILQGISVVLTQRAGSRAEAASKAALGQLQRLSGIELTLTSHLTTLERSVGEIAKTGASSGADVKSLVEIQKDQTLRMGAAADVQQRSQKEMADVAPLLAKAVSLMIALQKAFVESEASTSDTQERTLTQLGAIIRELGALKAGIEQLVTVTASSGSKLVSETAALRSELVQAVKF